MTVATSSWRPTAPHWLGRGWRTAVLVTGMALAVGVSVMTGRAALSGSKMEIVAPLVVVVGLILAGLAVTRFHSFVIVILVVRASIDLARVTGSSAGNTATNTSSSRLLDPSTVLAVVFLLSATLWLAAQARARRRIRPAPLGLAYIVFICACALSIFGSAQPLSSTVETMRVLAVVVMFLVLERLMVDRRSTLELLAAAYASLLFPIVYTTAGFLLGAPASESKGHFTRITGPFTQSNTFGRYLMVMVVFSVAMYPHLERRLRLVVAPVTALSIVYLALTYTRTALVGAVVGLVVVGLKQSKRVLATLVVVVVAALLIVPQMSGRFTSVATSAPTAAAAGPSHNSLEWRILYWTQVLPLADRNPATGIGLDMTQYQTSAAKQPHNDFIRAYVETGVVGLMAYVALLVTMVRLGRRAVRMARPRSAEQGVALAFLGCALAYVAVSLAANVMSNVVTLWYLTVLAAAASYVVRRHTDGGSPPRRAALAGNAQTPTGAHRGDR
jgi:O-antigen ligase